MYVFLSIRLSGILSISDLLIFIKMILIVCVWKCGFIILEVSVIDSVIINELFVV